MARDAAGWLARKDLLCRTVTIKVRYSDFTTVTRSHSAAATRDADDLARRAVALLEKTEAGRRPVRLLGASVHNLIDPLAPSEEPLLPFEEQPGRPHRGPDPEPIADVLLRRRLADPRRTRPRGLFRAAAVRLGLRAPRAGDARPLPAAFLGLDGFVAGSGPDSDSASTPSTTGRKSSS